MTKNEQYNALVEKRKSCNDCINCGLINPSQIKNGDFDSDEIGPWTRWHGNLHADVMIVGQDWGSEKEFVAMKGIDRETNPTNTFLRELMNELPTSSFYLTNAALCIRKGKAQGGLNDEWLFNCRSYLKEQIDIVSPKAVIALGQKTFYVLLSSLDIERNANIKFKNVVNKSAWTYGETQIFAAFHPGRLGIRNSGGKDVQKELWKKIGKSITA